MAPEGILQGGLGEGERVHRQIVNPDLVLVLLQEKYRIQQGVELEEISGPATPQLSPYTSVVAKMLSVVNVDEARKRNLSVAMKRFDEGLEELGLSGKLDSRAVGDTAMYFARGGRFEKMREVFELGKELQMIPTIDIFVQCMSAASASKNYTLAEQIFDDLKTYDLVPNEFAWRALIHAKACSKGADEGLALLKRIETMGVKIIIGMYNAVLSVMVDQKMYSRADELWIEMHSIPDTKLDLASFKIYTKALKYHGRVERAMFCYNELKALGLEPDQDYFATLFRTCAEAPFWVNGYQNTLIDVMRNMESNEILPNIEIYNAVIYGFGRACDAKAAEFYFWEMKRKGIQPDATTYNSFLNALAREQLVGRRVAGTLGRWTRPPQRLNREQLAALKLGPNKMAELSKNK